MMHAAPSFMQASKAEGNVFAQTKDVSGCHHTLTVWESKQSMRKFLVSGAHAKAMKITMEISDLDKTKVYGYETDTMPTWEEALDLWEKHGALHGKYASYNDKRAPPSNENKASASTITAGTRILRFASIMLLASVFVWKEELIGYYFKSKPIAP